MENSRTLARGGHKKKKKGILFKTTSPRLKGKGS